MSKFISPETDTTESAALADTVAGEVVDEQAATTDDFEANFVYEVPGATKIGDVQLFVPPQQIQVTEFNSVTGIPTLRTIGNPKLYTGMQEIRIEMELYFTSIAEFNRVFRPLLAQFRRTPFLPLQNEFVSNILLLSHSEQKKIRNMTATEASLQKYQAQLSQIPDTIDDLESKRISEFTEGAARVLDAADPNRILSPARGKTNKSDEDPQSIQQELDSIPPAIEDPESPEQEATKFAGLPTFGENIPVAMHSLQLNTIPGFPGATQCNLQLNIFNHNPYTVDMAFNKTEDDVINMLKHYSYLSKTNVERISELPGEIVGTTNKKEVKDDTKVELNNVAAGSQRVFDPSFSVPFKKFYQGLLREYITTGTWGREGYRAGDSRGLWTPKTYPELPYMSEHTKGVPILEEASLGGFDKFKFSGIVSNTTVMQLLRERTDVIKKIIDYQVAITGGLQSGITEVTTEDGRTITYEKQDQIDFLKESISTSLKILSNARSNLWFEFTNALAGAPYNAVGLPPLYRKDPNNPNREDGPFILHPDEKKYVPIDDYLRDVGETFGPDLFALGKAMVNVAHKVFADPAVSTINETLDLTGPNVVILNVTAQLQNKLVPVKILGYNLPTYQHIGAEDFACSMDFVTTDKNILRRLRHLSMMTQYSRRINATKAESILMDDVARRALLYEDHALTIDPTAFGPNILEGLGMKRVIIGDINYTTVKGNPGAYSVHLTLLQADTQLRDYEVLVQRLGVDNQALARAQAELEMRASDPDGFDVPPDYPEEIEQVAGVIDGDTIYMAMGDKVRILGIDTSETKTKNIREGLAGKEFLGEAATELALHTFQAPLVDDGGNPLGGTPRSYGVTVRMTRDRFNPDRDKFGRRLRYVEVLEGPSTIDGQPVDYSSLVISRGLSRFDDTRPLDPLKFERLLAIDNDKFDRNLPDAAGGPRLARDTPGEGRTYDPWREIEANITSVRQMRLEAEEVASELYGYDVDLRGGDLETVIDRLGLSSFSPMRELRTKFMLGESIMLGNTAFGVDTAVSPEHIYRGSVAEAIYAGLYNATATVYDWIPGVEYDHRMAYNTANITDDERRKNRQRLRLNELLFTIFGMSHKIRQMIKFNLIHPEYAKMLGRSDITEDILSASRQAASQVSPYKDLGLPAFVNSGLDQRDTVPDFYFSRMEILDQNLWRNILERINNKASFLNMLLSVNKVVGGEATTLDRTMEMRQVADTVSSALHSKLNDDDTQVIQSPDGSSDLPGGPIYRLNNSIRPQIEAIESLRSGPYAEEHPDALLDATLQIMEELTILVREYNLNVRHAVIPNETEAFRVFKEAVKQEADEQLSRLDDLLESGAPDLGDRTIGDLIKLAAGSKDISGRELVSPGALENLREFSLQAREELKEYRDALDGVSSRLLSVYTYGPFTEDSLSEETRVLKDVLRRIDAQNVAGRARAMDDTFHMARAFPTFSVWFVEEDAPNLLLFNDLYGYDAIESIDVIKNREMASDTCVIRLANLTGILTDPLARWNKERLTNDGTDLEQDLSSIFLQTGTQILVKMGYSNNPARMPTVFYGPITSIRPGDKVEIVCQSWGSQLTRPVAVDKEIKFSWKNHASSYGHVARRIIDETGNLKYLGSRSPYNEALRPSTRSFGERFASYSLTQILQQFGLSLNKSEDHILQNLTTNPITENIYLYFAPPWGRDLRLSGGRFTSRDEDGNITVNVDFSNRNIFRDIKRGTDVDFSWWIFEQTAWDALNELLLYHSDYIITTLPYNEDNMGAFRETLYIGPWDGYYKYTDKYDYEIKERYFSEVELTRYREARLEELRALRAEVERQAEGEIIGRNRRLISPHRRDQIKLEITKEEIKLMGTHAAELSYSEQVFNPMDHKQLAVLPGYKKVTSTHMFTSRNHIIANNIRADANNIYNHIVISFPKDVKVPHKGYKDWQFWKSKKVVTKHIFMDRGIPDEFRKTAVTFQKNLFENWKDHLMVDADQHARDLHTSRDAFMPQYLRVGNNILANSLRHMYDGELVVTMKPDVKPWDRVFLYDEVTQMNGIFNVRQVHHHFDAETGAWTAITPDLIVHERNYDHLFEDKYIAESFGSIAKYVFPTSYGTNTPISAMDMLEEASGMRKSIFGIGHQKVSPLAGTVTSAVGLGTTLLGLRFGLIGAGVGAIGGLIAGAFLGQKVTDKIWDIGVGYLLNQQGVRLTGLWYAGLPFFAGVEGMRREAIHVQYKEHILPIKGFLDPFGKSNILYDNQGFVPNITR